MKTLHRPGQKYYTLNLQRAVLKTRTISCDLHWGNQTYKRIRGDCTKLLYNIIASQCPSHMERGDGGCQLTGIVEARHEGAGGKNEGEFRIHAAKWGRLDHLQKQITVTFHTRAALAAIHCDPVVSPNSYSTVCNMTRATRLHRSPITMSDAASLNMHSAAIAAAATNKTLQWDI